MVAAVDFSRLREAATMLPSAEATARQVALALPAFGVTAAGGGARQRCFVLVTHLFAELRRSIRSGSNRRLPGNIMVSHRLHRHRDRCPVRHGTGTVGILETKTQMLEDRQIFGCERSVEAFCVKVIPAIVM